MGHGVSVGFKNTRKCTYVSYEVHKYVLPVNCTSKYIPDTAPQVTRGEEIPESKQLADEAIVFFGQVNNEGKF